MFSIPNSIHRNLLFCSAYFLVASCGSNTPWHKNNDETPVQTSTATPTTPKTAAPIANNGAPDEIPASIGGTITNLDSLIQSVNAQPWYNRGAHCNGRTIAIFDNGFSGLEQARGKTLPTYLAIEPSTGNQPMDTTHGTVLAQVIWGLCTGSKTYNPAIPGPKLVLYNTNGYTNLSHAVDDVTQRNIDMVLYSQVWEFGGNFDGQGFINQLVNRVRNAGIMWINAAGNYALASWQSSVVFGDHGDVLLPYQGRYVRLVVSGKDTPVKLSLAWNDFSDTKDYRTRQDLDLIVEDASQHELASSKNIQDGQDHGTQEGYSSHAREQISTIMQPGIYYLRVNSRNPNLFTSYSRLRIAADGLDVSFLDQTPDASIMIPADNPEVLTVGANDMSFSSIGHVMTSGISKPEVLAPSVLNLDNNMTYAGSSSAAAVATAVIALYESGCGPQSRQSVLRLVGAKTLVATSTTTSQQSIPTIAMPASNNCAK